MQRSKAHIVLGNLTFGSELDLEMSSIIRLVTKSYFRQALQRILFYPNGPTFPLPKAISTNHLTFPPFTPTEDTNSSSHSPSIPGNLPQNTIPQHIKLVFQSCSYSDIQGLLQNQYSTRMYMSPKMQHNHPILLSIQCTLYTIHYTS